MELSKQNELKKPAIEAPEAFRDLLEMLFAGTKSYGRQITGPALAAWTVALRNCDASLAEFSIAVEWWVSKVGGETPTPHDLVRFIEGARENADLRIDLRSVAAEARREGEDAVQRFRERHGLVDASPEERVAAARSIVMGLEPKGLTDEDFRRRRIALRKSAVSGSGSKALPMSAEAAAEFEAKKAEVEAELLRRRELIDRFRLEQTSVEGGS